LSGRRRWIRTLAAVLLALVLIVPVCAWVALAFWYRLPGPEWLRLAAAAAFAGSGVLAVAGLLGRRPLLAALPFVLAFAAVLMWWGTIKPLASADWAPDVSRQTTGKLDGDILTLTDVRDFAWHADGTFDPSWVSRSYDLSKLRTLDVFMSYWAGPQMAHVIMSFGFDGGEQLAWSIEVRRTRDGVFSPIADMFKSSPLVILAATEHDVVGVRATVRGEDVRLFRLRLPPERARLLLLEYVGDANALAARPAFYNSITTNCTTVIVKLVRAAGGNLPFDWRLIVNGYLPGFLYDRGAVDTRLPLEKLTALARINERAAQALNSPEFSGLIRVGVPSPLE
jgi:hypothetical protein